MRLQVAGTAAIGMLLAANASALPISATEGSDFTVLYDAIGGRSAAPVPGLTAEVRLYDFLFAAGGTSTNVTFSFDIFNTSIAPISTSRVSGLGFSTSPTVNPSGGTISGIFDSIRFDGNVPNQGVMEFCFSDVNCAGGGSGGVQNAGSSLGNSATLNFLGILDAITFDAFSVRYQSVSCLAPSTNCPGSASGSGTDRILTTVAEPAALSLLGFGLLLTGLMRRRTRS